MEGTLIKSALLAASFGTVVTAALFLSLVRTEEPEAVRDVVAVRHADAREAPEAPGVADVRTMVASYYSGSLEGNPTASGEAYRPERYTAAHRTLPLGTELEVSYGGESVKVIVNDRGPFVPGHDLDLSLAAAREIGLVEPGTAPVRVTTL